MDGCVILLVKLGFEGGVLSECSAWAENVKNTFSAATVLPLLVQSKTVGNLWRSVTPRAESKRGSKGFTTNTHFENFAQRQHA